MRVSLKEGDAVAISFTVKEFEFFDNPAGGDTIDFWLKGWDKVETGKVTGRYHLCGPTPSFFILVVVPCATYDDVIAVFDKFRNSVELADIKYAAPAPPHYTLYRMMSRMFGKPTFDPARDLPVVVGNILAAIMTVCNAHDNHAIEIFHSVLIDQKRRSFGESFPLLRAVYDWNSLTGQAYVLASANEAAARVAANEIFSKAKSIPPDQFPACVREAL